MASPEAFQKNIEALRAAIPELRAVSIGSTEGLSVAHWIAGGADPAKVAAMAERIAAMAAAAMNLAKRVNESISLGRSGGDQRHWLRWSDFCLFRRNQGRPGSDRTKGRSRRFGPSGSTAGGKGHRRAIGEAFAHGW